MAGPAYTLGVFKLGLLTAKYLPRSWCQEIAPAVARVLARWKPGPANGMRANLRVSTGAPEPAIRRLGARNVRNFSRTLSDYFYCASRPLTAAGGLLERWQGWEHLEQAHAAGKGIILLTGHLGHWELGGTLLSLRGIPMTIITLDEPSTALTKWREEYRRRQGISTILVGPGREFAFVEMLRVLRQGGCLAMLVDRPYEGTGVPVPFFGRTAEFSSAPALLWQHTGAAVIPAFVTQLPHGRYQAEAGAPLTFTQEGGPRAALVANTRLVASTFESIIREYPEQWYNYVSIWPASAP